MKLPLTSNPEEVLGKLNWEYDEGDVPLLFEEMKEKNFEENFESERDYHNYVKHAQDMSVRFAFVVFKGLCKEDARHVFNVYRYIEDHSDVFTQRIRSHVRTIISRHFQLTKKQQKRIDIIIRKTIKTEDKEEDDLIQEFCYECGGKKECCLGGCRYEECSPYWSVPDMLD